MTPRRETTLNKPKDIMRRDWDARARRNAFVYIASWRKDWEETSFFESGEQDYQRLVEPILKQLQFDPASKSMAELGCGAGRMTFPEFTFSFTAPIPSFKWSSRGRP